ncbi:MAG: hypothetical protein CL581_02940 [Alteromonadaceae bacterium]|nr:hypothetical protein [Alteromonadaceae bacterium]MBH83982.1 hypothetical protein [Alteromonadaceae bacterium]|tara:strand:- start:3265 stop:3615 length:351 start_codon:yes stop_codon:yes gene_type:complete
MKIRNMALTSILSATLLAPAAFAADNMSASGESKADRATPKESAMGTEHKNMHGVTFEKLDTNKDGQISEDELGIYGDTAAGNAESEAERNQMMMDRDTDGDGAISREEFEKGKMQ